MSLVIDPRVVDLRREFHLSVAADKENRGNRPRRSKDNHEHDVTSMLPEAWNSNYRRRFEWEVFRQVQLEVKRSAFIWTVGLAIGPVGERRIRNSPGSVHSHGL